MLEDIFLTSWHYLTPKKVESRLETDLKEGLSSQEAQKRLQSLGKNELPKKKSLSRTRLILEQIKSPLIYILLIAGVVVLFFKEYNDAIVIFLAVLLNTSVGYIQENKANEALKKLKEVIEIKAKVIRGRHERVVSYTDLVIGDLVVLGAGDKAPADGRIIESENLKINEMALTGEWLPAAKKKSVLPKDTDVPDRDNMVFMGTIVEDGEGKFLITATGKETQIGKVAKMVEETTEEETPLQKKISKFSKIIGGVILVSAGLIFADGIRIGKDFIEIFTIAVAVAVAAIPEGLPVAVTVILAVGMQAILKEKGLVRKLLAAETLGSTNIICTDKTLSLTEGKMKVGKVISGKRLFSEQGEDGKEEKKSALKIATFPNEAFIENPEEPVEKWIVRGSPTDKGILIDASETGVNKERLEEEMPRIGHVPFNSKNKFLASLNRVNEKEELLSVAGAPERIMEFSKFVKVGNRKQKLTKRKREEIKGKLDRMASSGLRVVGVAYKDTKGEAEKLEKVRNKTERITKMCENLVFVGLIGLKDPLRRGVKKAIKTIRKAGMRPIMVTGDYEITARAIAEEIGLKTGAHNIIKGGELDKLSEEEFKKKIVGIEVYARAEPKHKMRIVRAWQDQGEAVAMTGDGINDAPALKKADIGVALGSGTEVAKEMADLVLLNDNFNVIVVAVEQGRKILDNIRKVITYLLSSAFTETILVAGALIFRLPLPVSAAQILWINLVEDGLPGITLAFEPKEKGVMDRKPEGRKRVLLTGEMKTIIFIIGFVTDLILLGLFFWLWQKDLSMEHLRTIIFSCLAIDSLGYIFSCKNLRANVWHINPFSNKLLAGSVATGILFLVGAVYLPPLQRLLETVPLGFWDWIIVISLGAINIVFIEAIKWIFIVRRKRKNDNV